VLLPTPGQSTGTAQADEIGTRITLDLANTIRTRVKSWRQAGFPGVTAITSELITYWTRDERERRLLFCQREAAETVIFLREARADFLQGLIIPPDDPGQFVRYACKMATGSGKTAVMGMLAAWSILNKVASRSDRRFSDVVLVLCPNVTIRSVSRTRPSPWRGEPVPDAGHRPALMADLRKACPDQQLRPGAPGDEPGRRRWREGRSARPRIDTALMAGARQGRGEQGNILVLNDEAHHAYRIRQLDNTEEVEEEDELAEADRREATVWIEGLDKLRRPGINLRGPLGHALYLNRSGNDPGRPFPGLSRTSALLTRSRAALSRSPASRPRYDGRGDSCLL
jgi:type III restriction enzyme